MSIDGCSQIDVTAFAVEITLLIADTPVETAQGVCEMVNIKSFKILIFSHFTKVLWKKNVKKN